MIGKLVRFVREVAALVRTIRTFPADVRADREALRAKYAAQDEARRHYWEVEQPAYRRRVEKLVRANPRISLKNLERMSRPPQR